MNQTSVMAASILLAFVVFITMRGELTGYFQVLGLAPGGPVAQPTVSASTPSTGVNPISAIQQTISGLPSASTPNPIQNIMQTISSPVIAN
jgi:hypothetical protein